jgi:hypothetical protein
MSCRDGGELSEKKLEYIKSLLHELAAFCRELRRRLRVAVTEKDKIPGVQ